MDWRRGLSRLYIVAVTFVSLIIVIQSEPWSMIQALMRNNEFLNKNEEAVELSANQPKQDAVESHTKSGTRITGPIKMSVVSPLMV